jgi:hypothetical protein
MHVPVWYPGLPASIQPPRSGPGQLDDGDAANGLGLVIGEEGKRIQCNLKRPRQWRGHLGEYGLGEYTDVTRLAQPPVALISLPRRLGDVDSLARGLDCLGGVLGDPPS